MAQNFESPYYKMLSNSLDPLSSSMLARKLQGSGLVIRNACYAAVNALGGGQDVDLITTKPIEPILTKVCFCSES